MRTFARRRTCLVVVGVLACAGACASVRPDRARARVKDLVEDRTELRGVIPTSIRDEDVKAVRARVDALVAQPLTLDNALRIALLNNRDLRAVFEELGVAQAELVQAGLLDNPVIGGDLVISSLGYGLGGGLALSQSVLGAFLIPAKRRMAKARLKYAIVVVGHATLDLIREVKVAYVTVACASASVALHRSLAQVAEVGDALAASQLESGNISPLDRELFAAALDEARVELADALVAEFTAREHLDRLLGLWGDDIDWALAEGLDTRPPPAVALGRLEAQGLEIRLDLSAARFEVESLERAVQLRRRGIVPHVEAGAVARNEVGTDVGHEWVLGPSLSIALPIFDPGHADLARLRALLRQAQHRLQQAAIDARSEIRLQRERLVAADRKATYFAKTVLPRRESIAQLTMEQYNAMQVGTYQLLETRADELHARQAYLEAVRDAWIERFTLEHAVGGWLPLANGSEPGTSLPGQ